MKRYLLFAGPHYYPAGGTDDLIGDFDTMVLVVKEIRDIRPDWWNILDTKTGRVYDNYNCPDTIEWWAQGIDEEMA